MVDLPLPESPTIAVISPCRAVKDTPERASMSFSLWQEKDTSVKLTS
jgi:hypothetical protein